MPPIKPRKFQVSRRQLNKRVNYFFRESPAEDVIPLDTIICVSQPDEPAEVSQNDIDAFYCSNHLNCRKEKGHSSSKRPNMGAQKK